MKQGTQSRYTGMTQRDGVGSEVGVGRVFGMRGHMADSSQCMAITTTIL